MLSSVYDTVSCVVKDDRRASNDPKFSSRRLLEDLKCFGDEGGVNGLEFPNREWLPLFGISRGVAGELIARKDSDGRLLESIVSLKGWSLMVS